MIKETIAPAGLHLGRLPDLITINTPLRDFGLREKDDYEVLPPLGLGYILTIAKSRGHNVGLLDAEHHGLSVTNTVATINELRPRFAGMNILTPTRTVGLEIAKRLDPDINLIIGGPHATALPESTTREFTNAHRNTVLLSGQAQHTVTELLKGTEIAQIPGAYWLDHETGTIQKSLVPNLPSTFDTWPHIDREFLVNDPSIDQKHGRKESRIMTSLNCPFDCSFCAGARSSSGGVTQHRHPDSVAAEIQHLVTEHGIEGIRFVDDLFLSSAKRAFSILDAMDKVGVGHIKWDATGRANIVSKFSPESIQELAERGMHEAAIGIEAGSERLRKKINKRVSLEEIYESIRLLTHAGIKVKGYFIIGLPTETEAETQATISLAKRLTEKHNGMFRASIFVFRPYPGTTEWDNLIRDGWSPESLLEMHADGQGERAKHIVTTDHQFSELSPAVLDRKIQNYFKWQTSLVM
jgi:anaerobic magnesium-protoporphyrin IX monomethyl ester cyclase